MVYPLLMAGYLVGSVPFAFLLARRLGGVDVRFAGSENVGAANVFRTTRVSVGLAVAALDVAKGSAAVLLAYRAGADVSLCAATGVSAVCGHVFPVWLKFRGGKGVAPACGAFAVLAPAATSVAIVVFVATVWLTRYVSLGSITASLLLGPLAYWIGAPQPVVVAAAMTALLVAYRHRSNLVRLQAGTERRFGQRR